jgi:hypothetical protein
MVSYASIETPPPAKVGCMDRFRQSSLYGLWLQLLRVSQFFSSTISLGLFSARIHKILKLVRRTKASTGAVEGILAAAVLYTTATMILQFVMKKGTSKTLRWLLFVLDLVFVGAFIAVAVLARPSGPNGPGACRRSLLNNVTNPLNYKKADCQLPVGTFALAIFST